MAVVSGGWGLSTKLRLSTGGNKYDSLDYLDSYQLLSQVVQEAFINGVSTRKIEKLAQALGIETLSASQVLEINKGLNDQVEAFHNRPLEREYPVIWIDALCEKMRVEDRVVNMAVNTFTVLFQKLKLCARLHPWPQPVALCPGSGRF